MSNGADERPEELSIPPVTPSALVINGVTRQIHTDPEAPLLFALRNELGLVATRFGCGSNQCGACLVLIDGEAVASCDTPVSAAVGKTVTTVEGYEQSRELSALIDSFLAVQAAQCAYCTSGILISAAALLAQEPAPNEESIRAALERNLCRCGSHDRMVRAVFQALETIR